jgi:hypothetical protein
MAAKALDVSLTDGKLGRIDVLVPADLSLYGATGKAPLGDGSNKLDASWLPDLDGSVASAIGLPAPQYDSGWVTFTAGTELVLAHGLGTQPVLFIITYRDNYDTPIEKALTVTNYPVGVWRQRITTSLFLLYTSWSYVAYNDAGSGLTSVPVRVRAWRSGAVSGGSLSALTVKETDGAPSVSNVTEIQVPNSWLTDLGGGAVQLTVAPSSSPLSVSELDGTPAIAGVVSLIFPNASLTDMGAGVVRITLASGSGGGLTNPMTAAHDMVVGLSAATNNEARPAFGATGTESAHYYDGWGGDYHWPKSIDANDATYWSPGPCAGQWLRIDLGSAKLITAWRVLQEAAHRATEFKIQSSVDDSSWIDQAAIVGGVAESGVAALLTPTLARYWRLLGITGPPGSGYNPWLVGSFELHTGTPAGTPGRLAIGAEGTVLTVVSGAQAWATGGGASPGLLLYLSDTFR